MVFTLSNLPLSHRESFTDIIIFNIVVDRREVSCAYRTYLILCHGLFTSSHLVLLFFISTSIVTSTVKRYCDKIQPGLAAVSTEHISVVVFSSLITVLHCYNVTSIWLLCLSGGSCPSGFSIASYDPHS